MKLRSPEEPKSAWGRARSARWIMIAACGILWLSRQCQSGAPSPASPLEWIEVDASHPTALRSAESGRPFLAIGVNYFGPHMGWAPKLWHKFDPATVRQHLKMIHDAGLNTIRVFLTFDSFHRVPGQVDTVGLEKFRQLLRLCHEQHLHVIPTGPDHWEGLPDWVRGKDRITDDMVLTATAKWWSEMARLFRDEPAILAWDLLNEPSVPWSSAAVRREWQRWLATKYTRPNQLPAAYSDATAALASFDQVAIPARNTPPDDRRMRDFRACRESIALRWTQQQVDAIRQHDARHLITVGLIQWSGQAYLPNPSVYSGFAIEDNSRLVDLVTIHFYPIAPPRPCDSPTGTERNAAYLAQLLDECCQTGKPVMIGEFGWYGGGDIRRGNRTVMPAQTTADQVDWNTKLLSVSRGKACGWLNWAFADTPTSTDLTRWSGLWTEQLDLKPWGREFVRFARQQHAAVPPPSAGH